MLLLSPPSIHMPCTGVTAPRSCSWAQQHHTRRVNDVQLASQSPASMALPVHSVSAKHLTAPLTPLTMCESPPPRLLPSLSSIHRPCTAVTVPPWCSWVSCQMTPASCH
jgi:hypothetical protein